MKKLIGFCLVFEDDLHVITASQIHGDTIHPFVLSRTFIHHGFNQPAVLTSFKVVGDGNKVKGIDSFLLLRISFYKVNQVFIYFHKSSIVGDWVLVVFQPLFFFSLQTCRGLACCADLFLCRFSSMSVQTGRGYTGNPRGALMA